MPATPGKRRHYLPASAIGHFSSSTSGRLRERKVWILPKIGTPRLAKADRVGFGIGIYGYGKRREFDHDAVFGGPEEGVNKAVENILSTGGSLYDLDDWSKVAAYIAAQFVRGPDLEEEVLKTAQVRGWDLDKVAVGYPLNFQRVAAAVLRASWQFIHTSGELILGDRAITGLSIAESKSLGYFIPLRRNFGVIIGQPEEKPIIWKSNRWRIKVTIQTTNSEMTDLLNKMSWLSCRKEAYASSYRLLEDSRKASASAPHEIIKLAQTYLAASLIKLSAKQRMDDEMLIFKLLGGLQPPSDPTTTLKI